MTSASGAAVRHSEHPAEEQRSFRLGALTRIQRTDLLLRFAFGAAVSIVAGVIGKTTSPQIGGLFLAFPAILPATLTLLERRHGEAQAVSDVRGAAIGAVGMVAFAAVAAALLTRSAPLALVAAMVTWVVASGLLYLGIRALLNTLGEKQFAPELPTTEAAAVLGALRQQSLTVSVAESCTGGFAATLMSLVPRASDTFLGGVVAYTDGAKRELLGVPADMLERSGAVSAEVARAMAAGVRERCHSDIGASVTGMAGSGDPSAPAGTAYIAVVWGDVVHHVTLTGDRGPGRNQERQVRALFAAIRDVADPAGASGGR